MYAEINYEAERLRYLEKEIKQCQKDMEIYKNSFLQRKRKLFRDVVQFLILVVVINIINSDFLLEIIYAQMYFAAILLAAIQIFIFFKDLFCLFGEYGLPTFAKLFLGGIQFSYKELMEKKEVELAALQAEEWELKRKMNF